MEADHRLETEATTAVDSRGNKVAVFFEGNGIPCLFMGPGSIYIPGMPAGLKEQIQFIGVDHYWVKGTTVSDSEIQEITVDRMLDDMEAFRQSLGLDKILVLAPSAVGLLAMAYAKKYPENTLGVITIGAPLSMNALPELNLKSLPQESDNFMSANYSKDVSSEFDISTKDSKARWGFFEEAKRVYDDQKTSGLLNDATDDYIAELRRDEQKYYRRAALAQTMYGPWRTFNIAMRNQFFKLIFEYDPSGLKTLSVPVKSLLGLYDGMVAPYTVVDNLETLAPENFSYHIFDSAHMPHLEEPDAVTTVLVEWLAVLKEEATESEENTQLTRMGCSH